VTGAPDLSPEDAVERFIKRRETDSTERTLRSYEARLQHFVDWCDERDVDSIAALDPFQVDEFQLNRQRQGYQPATVKGQIATLQVFFRYLADAGIVDDSLPRAVSVPTVEAEDLSDDTRLAADDAEALLATLREDPAHFGQPTHATLEVLWHVGCRMGALRALDLEDVDLEDGTIAFKHRPSTGTPLKNKRDGERVVGIGEPVVQTLRTYRARERFDNRDDHGRAPFFSGRQGRPSYTTIRAWSYLATQPCLHTRCPHGRARSTCDYVHRNHASKCPSSRSPHPVRTGSITWQLNQGLSVDVVATRVNASPATIRQYYDKASDREEFEARRRDETAGLDVLEAAAETGDEGDGDNQ
jgi:site-specific recombinase XerD